MDNRKISICIPTWERTDLLFESFAQIYNDDRVSEIVIVDDCSSDSVYAKIKEVTSGMEKVKLFRNHENKGCYVNKMIAVSLATEEWVILFDSDNKLSVDYLDKIHSHGWYPYRIYAPDFARPNFNYKEFGGEVITRTNIAEFLEKYRMGSTALNTMNFFVNKEWFLRVWDKDVEPMTADSIYFNYCWLNKDGSIFFVKNLEYDHLVHPQSHYQNFNHLTGNFYNETMEKLKQLK